MTSPINPINRSTTDALTSNTNKTRGSSKETETTNQASPAAEDTVSLSKESAQVRELQQQLDSIPDVDAQKVEAIKQEIAKGNYPLDPERIAENLINLEKALTD